MKSLASLIPNVVATEKSARPVTGLVAPQGVAPQSWQLASEKPLHAIMGRSRPEVSHSEDLDRIRALPIRPPVDLDGITGAALVEIMTNRLTLGPRACKCAAMKRVCITELKPAQAWALYEAPRAGSAGGLLAPIGVGHGKTGLDILMALVIKYCRKAVLLIPPGLVNQLHADYLAWREHFRVPTMIFSSGKGYIVPGAPIVHVVPFSKFSREESTALLESLAPDLIIIDEAHKVRHAQTATTGRVLRYFANHPETRLCAWSGTLTSRSIKDYAHLSAIALHESSPLPLHAGAVAEWALAIDPIDWPAPMGALHVLCSPGEHIHDAYHRRLVSSLGVVATRAGAIDASIVIDERKAPKVPDRIVSMLAEVRATETRPDGEELVDAMQVRAVAKQLACGFYYRWRFPHGEPESLILDWFEKRKDWHKELREKLKGRREHLDSPLLCAKAAIRYYQDGGYSGDLPTWAADTWLPWREIRDKVYHETEAVWIDDYLAEDAAAWGRKHLGVIWYEYGALGARVAKLGDLALHEGGPGAEDRIRAEDGKDSIVASIKAHGTGRDGLQYLFSDQLVANPPASGDAWEQLLGRLHRIGQKADEVTTHVYRHTDEFKDAIDQALNFARYIQGTMGTQQKLLTANVGW